MRFLFEVSLFLFLQNEFFKNKFRTPCQIKEITLKESLKTWSILFLINLNKTKIAFIYIFASNCNNFCRNFCRISQHIKTVGYFYRRAPSRMFDRILNAILHNNSLHLHQTLVAFPRTFDNIPRNVWRHTPECLRAFPGMIEDIPGIAWDISRNVRRHSSSIFDDIHWNVWHDSPNYLAAFPGLFGNIPQNVWGRSPSYLETFPRI